jgi:hypothetical protein
MVAALKVGPPFSERAQRVQRPRGPAGKKGSRSQLSGRILARDPAEACGDDGAVALPKPARRLASARGRASAGCNCRCRSQRWQSGRASVVFQRLKKLPSS